MADDLATKLLIVGGGPGGYVAAIRAGQLGVDTILIEEGRLGGVCLNVGCIPSKALIHAAETFDAMAPGGHAATLGIGVCAPTIDFAKTVAWKDAIVARLNGGVAALLKRSKVRVLAGRGECIDGKTWRVATPEGERRIVAETVVVATGSEPVEIPALPFGGNIVSSTGALSLPNVPARLAVIGAGYIGLELGLAFAKLGSAVSIVEAAAAILPAYDSELTKPVARSLTARGVETLLGWQAAGLADDGALTLRGPDGATRTLAADVVLVAVGRRPRLKGFGLEGLDLAMNGPFLKVDDRCATSMRGVFAIGDVTGEPMLAHRAMAQGEMVAEIVAGRNRRFDKRAIPAVCFTDPEIVSVGLSPEEARSAGHDIVVGVFPFAASGRAMTRQSEAGFVRAVGRAGDHLLLGVQAVGGGVSELSAAFGLALEMGARLEDVADTIHAHPTLGEGFQEAAMKALGHGLHA